MVCVRGQDVASGGGGDTEGSHGGLWDEGIPLSKSIISATSSSGLGLIRNLSSNRVEVAVSLKMMHRCKWIGATQWLDMMSIPIVQTTLFNIKLFPIILCSAWFDYSFLLSISISFRATYR